MDGEAAAVGARLEIAAAYRCCVRKAEAQDLAAREQRRGFWIVGVDDRDPRLVREIAEKAVQLVEALVVEADVGDHRDIGAIERDRPVAFVDLADRSEEHTSELQSLMRTSYAVFCLKKKQNDE